MNSYSPRFIDSHVWDECLRLEEDDVGCTRSIVPRLNPTRPLMTCTHWWSWPSPWQGNRHKCGTPKRLKTHPPPLPNRCLLIHFVSYFKFSLSTVTEISMPAMRLTFGSVNFSVNIWNTTSKSATMQLFCLQEFNILLCIWKNMCNIFPSILLVCQTKLTVV